MIFNSPQDYIIPTIGYTQAELDAAVEAAIEATKEKAAKVCDGFERKKWEILAKGGVAAGLSPVDCAAAIRSME